MKTVTLVIACKDEDAQWLAETIFRDARDMYGDEAEVLRATPGDMTPDDEAILAERIGDES